MLAAAAVADYPDSAGPACLFVAGPDSAAGLAAGPDFVFGSAGPGLACSGSDSADSRSAVASSCPAPKPDCIWFPSR